MSIEALGHVMSLPMDRSADKLLLICLANYADENGIAYPSQTRLQLNSSLDRKTVICGLQRLVESGHIEDTKLRCGDTKQIVVYRLLCLPLAANATAVCMEETVPNLPDNSPEFPAEQSRISDGTVPNTGHGTFFEVPKKESKSAAKPPDVIRDLFVEGLPILQGLTGRSENQCRGMLGKLRKEAHDDCPLVLAALHSAADVRPSDPYPWLLRSIGRSSAPSKPTVAEMQGW